MSKEFAIVIKKETLKKFAEIYNRLFPDETIPFNSIIFLNDDDGFKELSDTYDGYTKEDINEELYDINDDFINICYPEGIVSFNLADIVDEWYTNTFEI